MVVPFILFGELWFWLLVVAAGITLIWTIESEKPVTATFDILVTLGILAAFSDVNPFSWVYHNPIMFAIGVAGYLALGTIWAVIKWYFYTSRMARRFEELRARYIRNKNERAAKDPDMVSPYLPQSHLKEMLSSVKAEMNVLSIPPKVVENKGRISIWMVYWPVSAAWTLVNDPIKDAFDWIQSKIAGMMQSISNNAFKKFDDLNVPS